MSYVLLTIAILNSLAVLVMIFIERKKPEIIVSWLLLFSFVPIIGFILYILFGGGLSVINRKMLKRKKFYNDKYIEYYNKLVDENSLVKNKTISSLIKFNIINSQSVPTFRNNVELFTDGNEKIDALIKDIKKAKHSINIEYYIFADDSVGKKVMNALIEKAREGIKVRLIYDSVGSLRSPRRFFRKLKKAGGEVKEFFPPLFYIRLINLKMNYRNHRKIVVIDGKVGYIGGINIRRDHCGQKKKVAPWLDAHIRVTGQAVYALQNTFFNFWQFCNKQNQVTEEYVKTGYFPKIVGKGESIAQVLTSGPDENKSDIKEAMIKMFNMAQKEILVTTPYFVPDDVYMNALKTAIKSGVKVTILLPQKPDKKIVYNASLSFVRDLLIEGAEVRLYKGFVHAKTIVIDDYAMMLGTANADYRSFALNFEISTILYDKKLVSKYYNMIQSDLNNSIKIDISFYKNKPFWIKLQQLFFRLFAPIM